MIGLRQCSSSGIVLASTRTSGHAEEASMRRHLRVEEEEETCKLGWRAAREAGGFDRWRQCPGSQDDPRAHPAKGRRGGLPRRCRLARHEDRRGPGDRPLDGRSGARALRCAEGPEAALVHRKPKRSKPRKLDGSQEAHLIALACSEPPRGRERWSPRLLAERFVSLECATEPISRELVRRALKKAG